MFGFEHHLALPVHLFLVGADQAVAGGDRAHLVDRFGARAQFLTFFKKAFGFDDLSALELPAFIGFLQHVAQIGIAVFGTGNLQRGGQRNKAALHAFNQPVFALLQQEHDVGNIAEDRGLRTGC